MDEYRFESGSVYEFDVDRDCYIFIGKLNGQTRKEFIEDYETSQLND